MPHSLYFQTDSHIFSNRYFRCYYYPTYSRFYQHFRIIIKMEAQKQYELKALNTKLIEPGIQNIDTSEMTTTDTHELLIPSDDHINRPSIKGAFRPVRNGNIRGSIFAMLASAIATGCLNLPIRVQELGVVPFFIVILGCCCFSYFGMDLIKQIILKYKVQSYAQMVFKAFGQKYAHYTQIILIIYTWAVTICIEVIFMKFAVQLLYDVGGLPVYADRKNQIYNFTGQLARIVTGVLLVVLNYKNLMMTDLREILLTVGKFSVIGISSCVGIIYITALFGFTQTFNDKVVEFQSVLRMDYTLVQWFKPLDGSYFQIFLQASAAIYFTFLNHQFIYPLISHLKKPTRKRVEYIFFWAHLQEFIIYGMLGLLGYLLLAQHRDILPISPLVLASIPTSLVTLGKIMLTLALFFRLPLQLFTTKEFIYQAMDIQRNDRHLQYMNIGLTSTSLFIAVLFQKVNMYFALLGGTFGVMIGALIPMVCTVKLIEMNDHNKMILRFMGAMSLICLLGAIQSVLFPI